MSTPITSVRFPFAINEKLGRLAQENDYEEYIKQLIRQVLFTAQGERINRPDFGAGVKRLVFAPNSPATASLAQTLIFQALTRWLGALIRTESVEAEAVGERLNITIGYTILAKQVRRFLNLEVTF
ncbi:MAG TPA: GPW/gp25 family protein [Blastocatellia bacterium]|nr:GPW/gp25 family protein [Blastocatellia bacterium]